MVALLIVLALAGPPRATLATSSTSVPLAVSSWCWGTHCGAPIAASSRTLNATRGSLVHVRLTFEPAQAHIAVAGHPVRAVVEGKDVSWRATRGGGVTAWVTGPRGWVTYVGQIRLR
jgi:hypothetical protein